MLLDSQRLSRTDFGALTFFNFSARESDVSASSRGLYSEPSLSWQEVLDAGLNFPPSFCMHCLAPKMILKWTVQDGQEYDQESEHSDGMLLIVGDL